MFVVCVLVIFLVAHCLSAIYFEQASIRSILATTQEAFEHSSTVLGFVYWGLR